jgi:hypothetical protein
MLFLFVYKGKVVPMLFFFNQAPRYEGVWIGGG